MKAPIILLGILLLIGSVVGAIALGEYSSSATKNERNGEDVNKSPEYVIAWGNFDVATGIAGLYPKQSGDIVMLAEENTPVKKGDVLLRVDDTLTKLKVEQAEAVAYASEKQFEESKTLVRQYQLQQVQQQAAIDALKHEIKKIEFERDTKLQSLDKESALAKTVRELYKESLGELQEKGKVEAAKAEQLKLLDAKLKIEQAGADWTIKKALVKEAREMLRYSEIVAPSDGLVLRVYVHKGETLGPNPRIQAIDFMPNAPVIVRAEVLQEWGRYVKEGQEVQIEDDTYNGPRWAGTVKTLSHWYAPTRSPVIEPFRYNDVRTLECIIEVKDDGPKKFIGQRVRATIKL